MLSTAFRRNGLLATAAFAVLATPAAAMPQEQTYQFDIPAQDLGAALRAFARQARQQVAFDGEAVAGKTSPALVGRYTVDAGLQALLAGSGLSVTRGPQGSLMIRPAGRGAAEALQTALDEVVVTAQKREERLLDVPVPVSVISGRSLAQTNQLLLRDYFLKVPGLQISTQAASGQRAGVTIRGIPPLGDIPTVGMIVDELPFGAVSVLSAAHQPVPDIDPGELSRIEVLRGPQGTLYGASGMGGLIKFVTAPPSTDRLSGRLQAGVVGVRNGSEAGYSLRGSVNVPLSASVAVRASGFTRKDPGYIDDPAQRRRSVNEAQVEGGRASLLVQPSDALSVRLDALYQNTDRKGLNDVLIAAGLKDLQQAYPRGVGYFKAKLQSYSAVIKGQAGSISVTSSTGLNIYTQLDSADQSSNFGAQVRSLYGVGAAGIFIDRETRKFVQEVRATAALSRRVELLAGVFYTHENTQLGVHVPALAPDGTEAGPYLHRDIPFTYEEYAAFADLTYRFTDSFDIQFGARQSEIKQTVIETFTGPYVALVLREVAPFTRGFQKAGASATNYLVTPRLKLSPDVLLYARFASGFRPGNVNLGVTQAGVAAGVPTQFKPDTTQNYELGLKGDFLHRKLSIDASLYSISWSDIQMRLSNPQTNIAYTFNGTGARSRGVEFSAVARPARGIELTGWITYTDAVLSEDFPSNAPAYGRKGNRLPFTPKLSGYLSGRAEFPLFGEAVGFVRGELSYVGDRLGLFRGVTAGAPLSRQAFAAFTQVGLSSGVTLGDWQADLFVNNLGDERGVIGGGVDSTPPNAFAYIQPRTVGVNITRSF